MAFFVLSKAPPPVALLGFPNIRELVQGAINLEKVSLQEHLKLLDIKLLGDGTIGGVVAGSMVVPTENIVE